MILPDFILPSRVNQCWEFSGMDSIDECLDINHFKAYPHRVVYQYNSRGFRDSEWPDSMQELQQATWCIGDSFTVGIGSPLEHTWPFLLGQALNQRTINVSMDGASNEWIARKALDIIQFIAPESIVIHWSYIHRREKDKESILDSRYSKFYNNVRDAAWPDSFRYSDFHTLPQEIQEELIHFFNMHDQLIVSDEDRRIQYTKASIDDDLQNILDCIQSLSDSDCKIIHSFIPGFKPESENFHTCLHSVDYVPEFPRLDWARDGHHYDVLTAQQFVRDISSKLMLNNTV